MGTRRSAGACVGYDMATRLSVRSVAWCIVCDIIVRGDSSFSRRLRWM